MTCYANWGITMSNCGTRKPDNASKEETTLTRPAKRKVFTCNITECMEYQLIK